MKSLAGEIPQFQAMLLRGIGTTLALAGFALWRGELRLDLPRRDWGLMLLRGAAETASAWFFITALFHMPLANLTAILQALPLTVTLAGALFLGEAVGWRRLTAILVGFGGVLLIVRPTGADFTIYSVYGVATVLCVTLRDLASRRIGRGTPSLMVALVSALCVTLFSGAGSAFEDWRAVDPAAAARILGAVVFVFGGYVCSVSAMRVGDLSFVAPFRYTSLVAALILGLLVFGQWPDGLTLIGSAIVVATGIYTFLREHRLNRIGLD